MPTDLEARDRGRNPIDAKPRPSFAAPSSAPGKVAQLVEQRTENPCVPGSIPGCATILKQQLSLFPGFGRITARPYLGRFSILKSRDAL